MVIDASNYLGVLEQFPRQCREALSLAKGMMLGHEPVSNIIVCGMGGSAIGGDILRAYLSETGIPVIVNRDYRLPKFVDNTSLVFAVSYSGNTEETLSAYDEAVKKDAQVIAITTGGKLAEKSKRTITLPKGYQPRAALGYLFFPMIGLLHNSDVIEARNEELNEMLELLKNTKAFREKGEAIAKKIKGKTPIVYASPLFEPVAYRWKTEFNENSKQAAFCHIVPEMNHNELVGYENMERSKFIAVFLRDRQDDPRIRKRMDICKGIIERHVDVIDVETQGNSLLARMFSTIYLGDMASYYLALENRTDPTPVDIIEQLKRALAR